MLTNGVGAESSGLLGGLKVEHGTYSGKFYIGGTNYSVSGKFDLAGDASNQVARTSGLGPVSLAMHLNWRHQAAADYRHGCREPTAARGRLELTSELAGSNLPSAEYTLLIPPGTNAPTRIRPAGYGYALITNHLGTVTVTAGVGRWRRL